MLFFVSFLPQRVKKKKGIEVAEYKWQDQNISLPDVEEGSCSCVASPDIHHMHNMLQSSQ